MEEGNTVRLKSGSLLMTIEEINGSDISCVWINDKDEIKRGVFSDKTLELDEGIV